MGAAKLGPKDGALIKWLTTANLPDGRPHPDLNTVVVIHRGPKGGGEVGWLAGDDFCLGHDNLGQSQFECGTYRVTQDLREPTAAMYGVLDYPASKSGPSLNLAFVVGDPGPFRFTGEEHRTLYQARATLDPDRDVTFLEWFNAGAAPGQRRICSAARARCFPDFP
ncbi:hypothetical protein [Peterkaempfera sp. SMS 1(5)a]|uniref:hypothetical protein n=1 Tax=Peterkaempfera podocarpi TaxID=3232308 RepID=UPI0036735346